MNVVARHDPGASRSVLPEGVGLSVSQEVLRNRTSVFLDKNIVMFLSAGRSGTQLLSLLLGLADDTFAVHEPEPTFRSVTETVRGSRDATLRFVRDVKLPHILSVPAKNYVETSHLFGKGPFEAFVELGLPFRLVMLDRDPAEVARSHWRIRAVPARARKKQQYLLRPDRDGVLPLPRWRRMTDYQLCYWYSLEIERRKSVYAEICRWHDIPVEAFSLADALDFEKLRHFCDRLGLCLPDGARAAHARLTATPVNRKARYRPRWSFSLKSLAAQEDEVWAALGGDGARLREEVAARYGWSADRR